MIVVKKYKRKFEWCTINELRIFPFMKLGMAIRWFLHTIFFDKIRIVENDDSTSNGNISYYAMFSWGKLSFVIVLITAIILLTHIY